MKPGCSFDTVIVAAMHEEVMVLRRRVAHARRLGRSGASCGFLCGQWVAIVVTGEGPRRATALLAPVLDELPIHRIIAIGMSGGLSPDLEPGALVVPRAVHSGRSDRFVPNPALLAAVARATEALDVVTIDAEELVLDPEGKAALWLGSAPQHAAVTDLESAAIARLAEARGLPWIAVRAVSDSWNESLPDILSHARRPDGSIDRRRIVQEALAHPGMWPDLARLARRARLCSNTLANAVEALLRHLPGE